MDDEIQLISDGDGLAVIGDARAVERFLASEGLASKDLGKGDSYEYTFREPGQYDYYCAVHPFMKSGVTVE